MLAAHSGTNDSSRTLRSGTLSAATVPYDLIPKARLWCAGWKRTAVVCCLPLLACYAHELSSWFDSALLIGALWGDAHRWLSLVFFLFRSLLLPVTGDRSALASFLLANKSVSLHTHTHTHSPPGPFRSPCFRGHQPPMCWLYRRASRSSLHTGPGATSSSFPFPSTAARPDMIRPLGLGSSETEAQRA